MGRCKIITIQFIRCKENSCHMTAILLERIKDEKSQRNCNEISVLAAACVSILAVALICIFLFANGIPTIAKIGPFNFLLGKEWKP